MTRGLELFRTEVAGILKDNCVNCHGGEKTRGDFDLATREGLLLGGVGEGPAVRPFSAQESPVLKMLRHEVEPHMPEKKPKLPDVVIAKIAAWIDLGAPYDAPLVAGKAAPRDKSKVSKEDRNWWAFLPLGRVEPPVTAHPGHPVDAFLLEKTKASGKPLTLAPTAEKRALIRRASFGVTGLPPTPAEVEAFLADSSPAAWEKVVDRLLASPGYGERWARHWLDVARFAESSGFEHDYDRPHAYHYRDFVIRALNEDMPFDQFAKWQIAGDEYQPGNAQAMAATGFLGAGVFPTQITANEVERTRYDAMDDMLSTSSSAFLGLTVGCARCHDHKFDPIPTKDYYEMLSAFTTTVRANVDLELDPNAIEAKKKHAEKRTQLEETLAKYEKEIARPEFDQWLAQADARVIHSAWQLAKVESISSKGRAKFTDLKDGSYLVSGKNPESDFYTMKVSTTANSLTGIKLEALQHDALPHKGPGRSTNGNFAISKISVTAEPLQGGASQQVKFKHAEASHQQNKDGLSVLSSLDEDAKTGWSVDEGGIGKDQAAVFHLAEPLIMPGGMKLTVTMDFQVNAAHSIGRPRLSLCQHGTPELAGEALKPEIAELCKKLREKAALTDAEQNQLFDWWKDRHEKLREHRKALADHAAKVPATVTPVMVCAEGFKPIVMHSQGPPFLQETHVLKRGDTNQKQGPAQWGVLQVINRTNDASKWKWTPPDGAKYAGKRRSLTNWLTDVEQGGGALMARVAVNRLWQHHFGRGIVPTVNDFGKSGELPSHPELLEWLAGELVKSGWKLKSMHRLLLLSAAYQQDTSQDAAKIAADPNNTFFLRRLPNRMEGEAVRDSALAVSGLLDSALYGKGTLDESSVRRSIYFTIKRSKLVNSMVVFDAPEPLTSQGSRPTTTVTPQALLLMNSPQVRTWASAFGRRLLTEAPPASEQDFAPCIRRAYLLALGREPRPSEMAASQAFIQRGLPAGKETALTDFCQTLLSLNEFAYLN